jgi:tetratricopeptide (TPR) repeat protein
VRGHFTEGAQWLDAVLDASTGETRLRARALHAACGLAVRRGKTAVLVPNTTEAAEIFRNAGDTKSLPGALQQLAVMQWATCDLDAAEETLLETVEVARELGMREVEATALHAESLIANTRSDYAGSQRSLLKCRALLEDVDPGAHAAYWVTTPGMHVVHDAAGDQPRMFFEDTVQHFRRVDNRIAIAYVLCDFANAARAAEDFEPASQALDQATELFRASDDLHGLAFALNASGNLARTRGEYETARSFLEQGHAARHEIGDARALRMSVSNFGLLAAREGDLQDARAQLNRFIALAHRSDDGAAIAGGLVNLGNVELDAGEPDRALPLLQESSARLAAQRLDRAAAWSRIAQIEATFALGRIDQTEACATAAAADLERIGDRQGLARLAQLDPRMSDESSANAPLSER